MSHYSSSTEKAEQPIYLWPKGADLADLKSAVLALNLPFRVRPFWFEPGKHSKVIALEPGFQHIVDHVYPKNEQTAQLAVQWALGMIDLPQAHTVDKKMRKVFGDDIRELDPDEIWPNGNNPYIGKDGAWSWPD